MSNLQVLVDNQGNAISYNGNIVMASAPSGTKTITKNGIYSIGNYLTADVQIPVPDRYLELGKDSNDYLVKSGTTLVNLDGITGISEYILMNAYINSTSLSGSVDLSNIVTVEVEGLERCFKNCPNITSISLRDLTTVRENGMHQCFMSCTGISTSDIDLSNLITVDAYGLYDAFNNCSNLEIDGIDLSSLRNVNSYSFYYAFYNCPKITGTIDLSSLETIATYGLYSTFRNCSGITSVDLSNLQVISGTNACQYMFQDCTSLMDVDLSKLESISSYGCSYMFHNCQNLSTLNISNLKLIDSYGCDNMFPYTNLTTVDLSKIDTINNYSCRSMFYGCTNLVSVSMAPRSISSYGCCYMFNGCSSLTSFDLSLVSELGSYALQNMFQDCTSLTELSFDELFYDGTNMNSAFYNTLLNCSNVTVHFPSNFETVMSSWSNIQNGMGGTNTVILFDLPPKTTLDLSYVERVTTRSQFYSKYSNKTEIEAFDLSNLVLVTSYSGCQMMFQSCTGLTEANFPKLEVVSNWASIAEICRYCSNVKSFNLNRLTRIFNNSSYALSHSFDRCDITGDASFPSLYYIYDSDPFQGCFTNCTHLTSLSFPALREGLLNSSTFGTMLSGVTGCTVHFPSNLSNKGLRCGGTNTIILFDLPATVLLTGANNIIYERNPIDDTATSLAWRKSEYDSDYLVVDWTSVYTSGITDPAVGDTIYSDAECTTPVTTISSIA